MTTGTVVVLASDDGRATELHARLDRSGFAALVVRPDPGPPATEGARACAAINIEAPVPPLSVVAFGSSALLLPSIALAQRAAHRAVQEYILVDPAIPPVSEGWPDARVTAYTDAEPSMARLRGWRVAPLKELGAWEPSEL